MSVREKLVVTNGETVKWWIADYFDGAGKRHQQRFKTKKEATAHHEKIKTAIRAGHHVSLSHDLTVAGAAVKWLKKCDAENLERGTLGQYRRHVTLHINPRIGNVKLTKMQKGAVEAFRDGLLKGVGDHRALSRVMARKVMISFKSILKANGVAHLGDDVTVKMAGRSERQLEVGVDIPTRTEIARIIQAATEPRWRALLMTAAFTGLRASELRGLRWADVDLKAGTISVTQRADSFSTIGAPKTAKSRRKIPIGPELVSALRNWKIACPKGDLAFPTSVGTVVDAANFWDGFIRAVARAGVVDKDGEAKYAPHSFRHFFASWCINRKVDGGRELPAKVVQSLLGHSSITMTLDIYGHLFPSDGDAEELAAAEASLLTATPMQLCGQFANENKG